MEDAMHASKMIPRTRKVLPPLTISLAAVVVFGGASFAQMSEIDAYDRAVTSQTKEAALAFLEEFRSSHLVGDLIESLRPNVAREVCADLPSGVSGARRACEQLRNVPVAEVPPASGEVAASTAQSGSVAAPTQPIETHPIGGIPPALATTGAVQSAAPTAGNQSEIVAGASSGSGAATVRRESALSSSGLPEPAATAPPMPIKSRPTVYVRADSAANILAQATEGSVIIGTAAGNTPLTVVARDRSWLKVLVPGTAGQAGWVHASGLQLDAGGIKVGPSTGTTAVPVAAGASTTKTPATQVATKTVPGATSETMTDEAMMSSGIGPVSIPSPTQGMAAAKSAIPAQTAAMPDFRIQLLSTKSPADTQDGWRQLQTAYPDLLAGLQFEVVEVDLGAAKGVWYRGFAGPIADRDEANMLCTTIRSRPPHNDCFVAGH
jgi:hypothetical protein